MSKVKNKTKKAMKLRFKLTGTGKLLRRKHGKRHILTKKSSKRKRSLSNPVLVATTILSKYKGMMGVS